jgi:hypothetical protein
LEKQVNHISKEKATIIVGDANARLHGRLNELEEEIIGNYCFQASRDNINRLREDEATNRQELVDFCLKNGYVVSNSFFNKPEQKKCSYSTKKPYEFTAPWTKDQR